MKDILTDSQTSRGSDTVEEFSSRIDAVFESSSLRARATAVACASLMVLLSACGNKGDLYLEELELSEEQQKLLNELDDETVKKKQTNKTATPE